LQKYILDVECVLLSIDEQWQI